MNNGIIEYIIKNEEHFIYILDCFKNNYKSVPKNIHFIPYFDNKKIKSIIAYTDSGHYYINSNSDNIDDINSYFNYYKKYIFSLYGKAELINSLNIKLKKSIKSRINYYVMKLSKKNFIPIISKKDNFICKKCDINDFNKLKDLQKYYHMEEVYSSNVYYPYHAEMNSFKKQLQNRITFGVFHKDNKNNKITAVSKANVNAESYSMFQIGGIFTLNSFRNKGLSQLCLTNLFFYIFNNTQKKDIILFVKKDNIPAITIYSKLGFKNIFESTICYF